MTQQNINIGVQDAKAGDTYFNAFTKVEANFTDLYGKDLNSRVIVQQASDLAGSLSSTVQYLLDGIIDMGSQSIEVPQGGLNLAGYNFDISKLTSSVSGYTMFTSPAGGSGNLLGSDYAVEVTGASSQVYNLISDTGDEAIEISRVNYNNCTSLGEIDNYRQGLESGTGRFGGSPSLKLTGVWIGGYFIDTSIVRSLDAGMTGSLFEAGVGFLMGSRFRSNQNIDLPASASFIDFAPANFVNASTVQIVNAIISRNSTFDTSDSNITPNMAASDLVSNWSNNVGIPNTFVGGNLSVTTEIATTISATSTFVDIAGTWAADDLQHFDEPSNGQLRHLGFTPREYKLTADLVLDSSSNNVLKINVRKWDDSSSSFINLFEQTRQVNALVGGRDVAFFTIITTVTLDINDYIVLQASNETATNDITAELDSFFFIEGR